MYLVRISFQVAVDGRLGYIWMVFRAANSFWQAVDVWFAASSCSRSNKVLIDIKSTSSFDNFQDNSYCQSIVSLCRLSPSLHTSLPLSHCNFVLLLAVGTSFGKLPECISCSMMMHLAHNINTAISRHKRSTSRKAIIVCVMVPSIVFTLCPNHAGHLRIGLRLSECSILLVMLSECQCMLVAQIWCVCQVNCELVCVATRCSLSATSSDHPESNTGTTQQRHIGCFDCVTVEDRLLQPVRIV
jgi:hypothetical protein